MDNIKIVSFEPKYQQAFKDLNVEWISSYFKMEESDYKVLNHPQEYILDNGGEIFVALLDNQPVGVCALIKADHPQYEFELAKMAVSLKTQGKGIGFILGNYALDWARNQNVSKIFLDSNTSLEPAIRLYKKLGFVEVKGFETPYERTNIQMLLTL